MQRPIKPKKKPLQIYFTDEQLEKLKIAAYSKGVSMNVFVLEKLNKIINA
jgi:predicted HicB family RNase H-like nuclease